MRFQPGDRVVYPSQGAGVVQEITSREVLGETRSYLKIAFVRGDMEVLVPLEKGREVGLRPTVDADELPRLERAMREADLNLPQQWPPRYRAEQEIVSGGDAYALAKLVGALGQRDAERGLAATERDVMEHAKALLASEFALVADTDLATANERLAAVLRERVP